MGEYFLRLSLQKFFLLILLFFCFLILNNTFEGFNFFSYIEEDEMEGKSYKMLSLSGATDTFP